MGNNINIKAGLTTRFLGEEESLQETHVEIKRKGHERFVDANFGKFYYKKGLD